MKSNRTWSNAAPITAAFTCARTARHSHSPQPQLDDPALARSDEWTHGGAQDTRSVRCSLHVRVHVPSEQRCTHTSTAWFCLTAKPPNTKARHVAHSPHAALAPEFPLAHEGGSRWPCWLAAIHDIRQANPRCRRTVRSTQDLICASKSTPQRNIMKSQGMDNCAREDTPNQTSAPLSSVIAYTLTQPADRDPTKRVSRVTPRSSQNW